MSYNLGFFIAASLFAYSADALNCYTCDAYGTGSCFDPVANQNLVPTCSLQSNSKRLPTEFQKMLQDVSFANREDNSADVRCVHYERLYYLKNITEVYRGCVNTNLANSMCSALTNNQNYYYYNLTKCNVCNEDLCNSGENLRLGLFASLCVVALSLVTMLL